jgi:ribose 1,5-bisphosphokinase
MSEAPAISTERPAAIGPGRFVLVVGPSGAGKDTLLGLAKTACADDANIVFPRRAITRAATASEDNEQLNPVAFREAVERGAFAVNWEAHGHCYGLRSAIDDDIRAGRTVIANVSRIVIGALRRAYLDLMVIAITAPPEILARRLASRGRGSDGKIEQRLGRTVDDALAEPDVTIVNMSSAEYHARQLVRIVKGERWDQ